MAGGGYPQKRDYGKIRNPFLLLLNAFRPKGQLQRLIEQRTGGIPP
jgi:hypothetical protein